MSTATTVYDQIAEFMAAMDPIKMIAFKASPENQNRLDQLLDKQKESGLTRKEKNELEHHLIVNRIIGLAKARARHALNL